MLVLVCPADVALLLSWKNDCIEAAGLQITAWPLFNGKGDLVPADKAKPIACPDIGASAVPERDIGGCTCISAPPGSVLLCLRLD